MSRLPVLSGKALLKLLEKNGFRIVRQKGSHIFVERNDGAVSTAVPVHANEDLGKGILKSILRDLELGAEDLERFMQG